jgi:hypothetical protein
MNLGESCTWEIPQHKVLTKLGALEKKVETLTSEVHQYKKEILLQNKTINNFDKSLKDNRIMYCELLKMQKKFHLETKNILEQHKDTISKKLEQNILGYKDIVDMLKNNKETLSQIDNVESFKELKKLKPLIETIKTNNQRIEENLANAFFKQRRDNLFWRSYNNNFMGLNSLWFQNTTPIVSVKLVDDNDNDNDNDNKKKSPNGEGEDSEDSEDSSSSPNSTSSDE